MSSPVGLPNVKLCMWLFLVSEVMFFAGLIGSYIVLRFGTYGWPNPTDILAVRVTAFNTFLLICSSVTMVKAFQWSDAGDRSRAKKYLFATIVGGATFVGIQLYEYHHLFEQPSTALLDHVEDLMAERGLTPTAEKNASINGSSSHVATAAAIQRASFGGTAAAAAGQDGKTADSTTTAQNAELEKIAALLKEGRPEVPHRAPPSEMQKVNDWDTKVLTETVKLSALFPDDDTIRNLGRHHWLYPEGFRPGDDVFTSTFYIMTGFHGAHVAGGVIALLAIFGLYWFRKADTLAIEVVGLYWHFVDLVWIILFTIVYLM